MKILKKLHTHISVVICWMLFVICFFGTVAYFKDEIDFYMQANLSKSIQNTEHSNFEEALDFALEKYKNYDILSIKTPPYFSSLFEINYYNENSSKSEKKSNIAYFDKEEYIKNSTLASKFLWGIHYKIFPAKGTVYDVLKAFISVFAALMMLLVVSGFFIWNKKIILNLNNKNNFVNLFNFHIVSGIFLGIFLFWMSFSGIGLNYIRDLGKIFSEKSAKPAKAKTVANSDFSFDKEMVLKAYEDARIRLNSDDLNVVLSKNSKNIMISKTKNDRPFVSFNVKNTNTLVYLANAELDEKLSEKNSKISLNEFNALYELFFNTHRVQFAPLFLKILLAACGVLACVFVYKAMLLSAEKRKNIRFKALAISALSACVNATLVYFIVNKILENGADNRQFYEQNAFWLTFALSIILSFIFVNKTKILKLISLVLFFVLLLCDYLLASYTTVSIAFNTVYILIMLIIARSLNANS